MTLRLPIICHNRQFVHLHKWGEEFELFARLKHALCKIITKKNKTIWRIKWKTFTHNVSEKAEEMVNDAKEKAGSTQSNRCCWEITQRCFKKNKPEDAEFTEEAVDPKDIEIAELKKEMDELRDK